MACILCYSFLKSVWLTHVLYVFLPVADFDHVPKIIKKTLHTCERTLTTHALLGPNSTVVSASSDDAR